MSIHTAQVTAWGSAPKYVSVPAPETAALESGIVQVTLLAAGLHHIVKSRAAGKHYTSTTLPHIPGVDGIGLLPSGKKVYFNTMATGGSMSELVNVPLAATTPLPDGLDPVKAAALLNPAMSSWIALKTRTTNLPTRFTVVVLGATSTSGNVAISIARAFGAGKVIGVARNAASLEELDLDDRIVLKDPVTETDFSSLGDVHVVLDYVYGPAMVHLLSSLKSKVPTQYVHVGAVSQQVAELPGAVLRSKDITIRGAGPGAWSMEVLKGELPKILEALRDVKERNIKVVKLANVEKAWSESEDRIVFVP